MTHRDSPLIAQLGRNNCIQRTSLNISLLSVDFHLCVLVHITQRFVCKLLACIHRQHVCVQTFSLYPEYKPFSIFICVFVFVHELVLACRLSF